MSDRARLRVCATRDHDRQGDPDKYLIKASAN